MKLKLTALMVSAAFSSHVYATEHQFIDFVALTKNKEQVSEKVPLFQNVIIEDNEKTEEIKPTPKSKQKTNETELIPLEDIKTNGMKHTDGRQLLQIIGLQTGKNKQYPYNEQNNRELQARLMASGFFESAEVSKDESGKLLFTVKENPVYSDVKIEGGKLISNKNIVKNMAQIGVVKGRTFNARILEQFKHQLQNEYTAIGKPNAKLNVNHKVTDGGVELDFQIDEGETVRINRISIQGNQKIPSEKLLKQMKLDDKGILPIFSDRLNHQNIKQDLMSVIDYYQENGYFDAQTVDVKFTDTNDPNYKDVTVYLSEGDQYYFLKPKLVLPKNVQQEILDNQETLSKLIVIKEGNLFKKSQVVKSLSNLENYLTGSGYAFGTVNVEPKTNASKQIEFVFTILPKQKVKVGKIIINGNEKTQNHVIEREMRQKEGEWYDLEKIRRSKERLDLTGFFNEVQMKSVPSSDKGEDVADIQIDVKERKTGALQASLGYIQDTGFNVGLSAEDRNFKGTGNALGASVNYGKTQQDVNIRFNQPFFTNSGISLNSKIYGSVYDPRKKENNRSYKTSKYGLSFNFGIPLTEYNKLYLGAAAENMAIQTFDNAPKQYRDFMNNEINQDKGKFKGFNYKGTIGWGINTTNKAHFPNRGYITSINGEITLPGSKLKYYKVENNNKLFLPVGEQSSLMLSANLAYGNKYGKHKSLPFFENYSAGGIGSVRGYNGGTLGPKIYDKNGELINYGGNKMATVSAEYFAPLPFVKNSDNVRISAFVDGGSVWDGKIYTSKDSDNGKSVYGKETYKSSFKNEFRASAGLAWTWLSPMGAVKFTYALPLNKKREDQIQKFQFQIGSTF